MRYMCPPLFCEFRPKRDSPFLVSSTHIHIALAARHLAFSPRSKPCMRTLLHFSLLFSLFACFVFSGLLWAHHAYTFLQYLLAALCHNISLQLPPPELGHNASGAHQVQLDLCGKGPEWKWRWRNKPSTCFQQQHQHHQQQQQQLGNTDLTRK